MVRSWYESDVFFAFKLAFISSSALVVLFSFHFDCSFLSCLVSSYFADFWFHYCMPYGQFCRRIAASTAAAKFFFSFVCSFILSLSIQMITFWFGFGFLLSLCFILCYCSLYVCAFYILHCAPCAFTSLGLVYLLFSPTLTFVCLIYIVIRIHFSFSRLMCVYPVFWSFHHDWMLLHTLWLSMDIIVKSSNVFFLFLLSQLCLYLYLCQKI